MPSLSQKMVCVRLVGIDGEVEGQLGLYNDDGSLRSYEVRLARPLQFSRALIQRSHSQDVKSEVELELAGGLPVLFFHDSTPRARILPSAWSLVQPGSSVVAEAVAPLRRIRSAASLSPLASPALRQALDPSADLAGAESVSPPFLDDLAHAQLGETPRFDLRSLCLSGNPSLTCRTSTWRRLPAHRPVSRSGLAEDSLARLRSRRWPPLGVRTAVSRPDPLPILLAHLVASLQRRRRHCGENIQPCAVFFGLVELPHRQVA